MKYAFKKICINASFPTTQYGHIQQTYLVNQYKDNLYARVYSFKDDNCWLIHATCDLIGIHEDLRNYLQDEIRKHYQDNNIHFVTSATHTHYANNPYDTKYKEFLTEVLLKNIYAMEYMDIDSISVSYRRVHSTACGKSRISDYETNLEFLSAISFYSNDKIFLNIIINNCHPTTLKATTDFFSAEYPGILMNKLENEYKNVDFVFLQGAAGDISSRFTRTGQEYKDMLVNATNIYDETIKLLNSKEVRKPFICQYKEKTFDVKHNFEPIDLSKTRSNLSPRELQVIEYGKQIREKLVAEGNFIKQANVACIDFGAIKVITSGNELFSNYMSNMNLDERMLICYTNGDWAYVLPRDFDFVTYEMFYDTWSLESKNRLAELLEKI